MKDNDDIGDRKVSSFAPTEQIQIPASSRVRITSRRNGDQPRLPGMTSASGHAVRAATPARTEVSSRVAVDLMAHLDSPEAPASASPPNDPGRIASPIAVDDASPAPEHPITQDELPTLQTRIGSRRVAVQIIFCILAVLFCIGAAVVLVRQLRSSAVENAAAADHSKHLQVRGGVEKMTDGTYKVSTWCAHHKGAAPLATPIPPPKN